MKFHIITPLSRYGNIDKLAGHLVNHRADNDNLIWHVITDRNHLFGIYFRQLWIEHYTSPNDEVEFWQRCNHALNWFLSSFPLVKHDYYLFMNDDDAYEEDFFEKLYDAAVKNPEVIIVSMKRGQHTPAGVAPERAHGTDTLIAKPENMKPGHVGIEQIIVRGDVLSPCRLPMHVCGDGMMVEWIVQNHYVVYLPETYALFNYLEPGRWD